LYQITNNMNFIKGYNPVSYKELQKQLSETYKQSGKTPVDVAAAIEVKTTSTVFSAINSDEQIVSDKVLSGVFQAIDLQAFILWINGERMYFLKSKN
jgi:hypothetical protein